MVEGPKVVAVVAEQAPSRTKRTVYPKPFTSRMAGRGKSLSVICSL